MPTINQLIRGGRKKVEYKSKARLSTETRGLC